jgi:hypothetical protein
MNIGYYLVEEEEREKRAAAVARLTAPQTLREQLAEVERRLAEVKAQLDRAWEESGDQPSTYALRKEHLALFDKRQELTEKLKKGSQ